jgi:hypothetical protein
MEELISPIFIPIPAAASTPKPEATILAEANLNFKTTRLHVRVAEPLRTNSIIILHYFRKEKDSLTVEVKRSQITGTI